ncbi:MAG: exodeoxyribonuclease III [Myxococcales bacterium]|nr:exodeoxyribonuclease III [Myxococcales bacterium]
MRLVTWNVNSIRARAARLTAWLEANRPDCVCLQETKVEDADFPTALFTDLGYHVAIHGQKSYNGVAIAARGAITDVATGLGEVELDEQARLIAATVDGVRVASVYVPNGQAVGTDKYSYKLAWLAGLRRWLDRHDRARPLVLGGDWNIAPDDRDVHDPARWAGDVLCSEPERAGLRALLDWGLVDVFRAQHPDLRAYSWWDYRGVSFFKDQGLRIDHFLADPTVAARVSACTIDREARKGKDASDHAPVIATLT